MISQQNVEQRIAKAWKETLIIMKYAWPEEKE